MEAIIGNRSVVNGLKKGGNKMVENNLMYEHEDIICDEYSTSYASTIQNHKVCQCD